MTPTPRTSEGLNDSNTYWWRLENNPNNTLYCRLENNSNTTYCWRLENNTAAY